VVVVPTLGVGAPLENRGSRPVPRIADRIARAAPLGVRRSHHAHRVFTEALSAEDSRKSGTPIVALGVRQITVPDLIGKTQKQAAALLNRAGATTVTYTNAGTPPRGQAGRVQGQAMPANTTVPADPPITMNIYGN
jgi:hypothetical protein